VFFARDEVLLLKSRLYNFKPLSSAIVCGNKTDWATSPEVVFFPFAVAAKKLGGHDIAI
jgi:hypothetical protein